MALDPKKFIARFVLEAREHIGRLEAGLAALNAGAPDAETLNGVFRSAHTIKGSSRMLKLTAINETAHQLEDILDALRGGKLSYSAELGHLIQRGVDAIASQVEQLADGQDIGPMDAGLSALLRAAVNGDAAAAEPPEPEMSLESEPLAANAGHSMKSPDTVRISMSKLDELIKLMGEVIAGHERQRQRVLDLRKLERMLPVAGSAEQEGQWASRLHEFSQKLRDDVLNQSVLMEDLHGRALIMRMLPLGMVFEPAPRMVRELGRSIGREVECVISGMEIELDRQLIDRLGDPLLHLLRNAVDHGIEDPDQRERAGKPRHGHISLSARQDAGSVIIEVSDDGGGIALDAIRDKVLKKGLVPAEQIQALSESEVIDLIFLPGLSTSAIISDVSGRGVGMDVVKRCIVDELQGVVEVDSRPGNGTRFTLRLPLSLAMMRVLLVEAGGQVFGFTGQQIARIVQLPVERMMEVAQRQVVVVDNEFIPVVTLSDLLSLPSRQYASDENVLLAVVQVRSEKLAIRIDALLDERDMVIKPLPPHLEYLDMVSGMVMTGDNALVSVLHAPILLDHARKARSGVPAEDQPGQGRRVEPHILVVDDSLNTREIERDVLEAHGYRVTLAEDGRDGLFKARQKVFDAVLTDVEMPNMDGFSLTSALREDERYHAVPIIIITSRQKEEDRRRGVEVGADAYIVKGDFDQSNLIEILKNIVG